jgi:multidrug efflux pump subunit AcrB
MFSVVGAVERRRLAGEQLDQYVLRATGRHRRFAVKWDGEWQITYETFRDMGLAYAAGLVLIYLLVVAQFRSYVVPLVIMAPIPLTVIGVMPGPCLARRAVHRDQHDRHDRAGRHHRPQLDPAGRLHQPGARRRAWRWPMP